MNKARLLHCCFKTYIGCKDYCVYHPKLSTNNCLFGTICNVFKKIEYTFRLTTCSFLELFNIDIRNIITYKKITMTLLFFSLIISLFPLISLLMFIYKISIENEKTFHQVDEIVNVETTLVEGYSQWDNIYF